jgi:hypothetical protein
VNRRVLVAFSTAAAVTSALSLRRFLSAERAPSTAPEDIEAMRLRMERARDELLHR